jgi:hypothetical protein
LSINLRVIEFVSVRPSWGRLHLAGACKPEPGIQSLRAAGAPERLRNELQKAMEDRGETADKRLGNVKE